MSLTNLLEKIESDHENPIKIENNNDKIYVILKTHHNELLVALKIAIQTLDYDFDSHALERIEAVLKGCGDGF